MVVVVVVVVVVVGGFLSPPILHLTSEKYLQNVNIKPEGGLAYVGVAIDF